MGLWVDPIQFCLSQHSGLSAGLHSGSLVLLVWELCLPQGMGEVSTTVLWAMASPLNSSWEVSFLSPVNLGGLTHAKSSQNGSQRSVTMCLLS